MSSLTAYRMTYICILSKSAPEISEFYECASISRVAFEKHISLV